MKKSITEVYLKFYRDNLRNLFILNFVIIGSLVSFLAYHSYEKSLDNAKNFIELNKNYITGLVLAGGEETIRDFLNAENKKNNNQYIHYHSSNEATQTRASHEIKLNLGTETLGTLEYGVYTFKVIPWLSILMLILVSLVFSFFMKKAFDSASKFLEEKIVIPMKNLSMAAQGSNTALEFTQLKQNKDEIIEVTLIRDAFIEFAEKLVDTEVAIAKTKVAQQVAHDIRSPLSALEMISSNLAGVEEEKRLIIRNSINRIRDIANTLSKDNRPKQIEVSNPVMETTLLSSVIEMMVTEKRFEISKRNNIQILFNQSKESYGLFANTVLSEFKRILSNLMNNSIEAIVEKNGTIEIKLKSERDQVQIIITDNGCGMNEADLNNVLQNRVSLKRNSSKGLGLSHAMDSIQTWGGALTIKSKPNIGTSVVISLKQEPAPKWFVDAVDLKQINNVIVVDDDQTIHQMWDALLNPSRTMKKGLLIHHFNDCDSVKKFYGKHFVDLDEAIFLVDYEIHNQSETGLSLIELLGIQSQSILVTSHYENEAIRKKCLDLGLGMIPKSMAGFVKIKT